MREREGKKREQAREREREGDRREVRSSNRVPM